MVVTTVGAGRIPPAHTPRVGDEADPVSSAAALKSPKSMPSPRVAMVMYSMTLVVPL